MLICIRGAGLLPAGGPHFGDYLRALITANVEHNPEDAGGLRFALLESFRSWGIIPKDINTYSVESLMWKPIEEYFDDADQVFGLKSAIQYVFNSEPTSAYVSSVKANEKIDTVVKSMERILRENDRRKIFYESQTLSGAVHNIFDQKFAYYEKYGATAGNGF